jgi:hypothetical protein
MEIPFDGPPDDLCRAILDGALQIIATPEHHFTDRSTLLTAIALEGYGLLTSALGGDHPDLLELGLRYVGFARDHPAHLAVMVRRELYDQDHPMIRGARSQAIALLHGAVAADRRWAARDRDSMAQAAWSLAHGFTTLWTAGGLRRPDRDSDPVETFRTIALTSFP